MQVHHVRRNVKRNAAQDQRSGRIDDEHEADIPRLAILIGERHQGFNIIPVSDDKTFKNYRYRMYFLANENGKARYVRLMFIIDPSTTLILRDISLDITPYTVDLQDSTYLKFKEKEEKEGYRKK